MDDDDDDDGGWRTTGTSNLETSLSLGSQTPSSSFGSEYRQSSFCVAPLCLSLSYSPRFREAETVRHRNAAFKNSLQMTQPPSISISKPPKQSISVTKSSLPNVKASRRPKKKRLDSKNVPTKQNEDPVHLARHGVSPHPVLPDQVAKEMPLGSTLTTNILQPIRSCRGDGGKTNRERTRAQRLILPRFRLRR